MTLLYYLLAVLAVAHLPDTWSQSLRSLDQERTEYSHGVVNPPVFRPGSGAEVATATTDSLSGSSKHRTLTFETLKYFTLFGTIVTSALIVMHMLPGHRGGNGRNHRDYQYRVPPAWSPETEATYPFRA